MVRSIKQMRSQFSTTLLTTTWLKLDEICLANNISKAMLTDLALQRIFEEIDKNALRLTADNDNRP